MKNLLHILFLLTIISCNNSEKQEALVAECCTKKEIATCTGSKSCNACKNCKYCKHCSKSGNSCGVCK